MTKLWQAAVQLARARAYRHAWKLAIVLALLITIAGAWLAWPRPPEVTAAAPKISAQELETAQLRWVIVYVSGAVRNPGMYRLEARLRVVDAIAAAGGLSEVADQTCLPNLSAHLKDGKQIDVPLSGRCKGTAKKVKLDINTASRQQLLTVPGVDPDLADAIVAYREASGGFQKLSELKSGLGIDAVLYKQLQKGLTVP